MTMRTVTLELLRHGPAHNQLLSPLTPYLALCGNHEAETVHVGLEHLQLTRYIEQLRYAHSRTVVPFALQDASREVSRLLESIRSLTAELATSDPLESRRMIHLRLVLSASELAMLPFELATAQGGMPGQGQPLLLQTGSPVCLTREVRRVSATTLQWPAHPRILMVHASPSLPVPVEEHLAKLKAVLEPYVDIHDKSELDAHLTVIRDATLEKVREACSRNRYTHVHILAHGTLPKTAAGEARHGLAFHSEQGEGGVDVVSGERLASALRCHLRVSAQPEALSSPVVVTIASCDSANQGDVVAPGASIAHALHEQGIPLVIGSQFPLTPDASVTMVELLYRRMLEGDDPRAIVHDLRQALYTEHPERHDWATVVVYAAFPNNLSAQIQRARFEQARRALVIRMARASKLPAPEQGVSPTQAAAKWLADTKPKLLEAMDRFEAVAPKADDGAGQVTAWGVLASAWKQVAFYLGVGEISGEPPEVRMKPTGTLLKDKAFRTALRKARSYYYRCYQMGAVEAWPLVQYLALTVGLGLEKATGSSKVTRTFKRLWTAALVRAEDNLQWGTVPQKSWALASKVELALLSVLWRDPAKCRDEVLRHLQQVLELKALGQYEESGDEAMSLWRQLERYGSWGWGSPELQKLSAELAAQLQP